MDGCLRKGRTKTQTKWKENGGGGGEKMKRNEGYIKRRAAVGTMESSLFS